MEQLSLIDEIAKNDESDEEIIRNSIMKEIGDPEYIKYLFVSINKDRSISVKAKSFVAAKINLSKKKANIEFKSRFNEEFSDYHIEAALNGYSRISVLGISDVLSLSKLLSVLYMKVLCELGGESFGCCHRYEACSDELKCLHPNVITAQACAYKRNL